MVLYFHYHLKCRHIHDKKGAIEVYLLKSSRMNFYHCYYLKLHQINMNRQDLYLLLQEFKKMVLYFHYHLKCRHIHDKKGAIEVDLLKSSRKNFYHCYYMKLHQININRQDMYLICKNLRKWSYIFIITSNVGIFMTKKVLLKLIFWNQVGWIFIIATIWNCIKLIWIDRICIFVARI